MTDEQIVKALGKWLKEMHNAYEIHLVSGGRKDTDHEEYIDLMDNTINLITRQQEEIERLQNTIDDILDRQPTLVELSEKYAASEAVKEFAERLCEGRVSNDPVVIAVKCGLKEMVGDKTVDVKPDTPQEKLSAEEFYDKFCSHCGSLRCEGMGTVWFEGCGHKELLKEEK